MAREDTIAALVRRQGALGDHVLLVCDRHRLTYGEADRRSRAVAGGLLAAGVGRGTRVALLIGNSVEFAAAFLAVTRIGGIAMPFSTLSTAHELEGLLFNSDAEYLIAAETYRDRALAPLVEAATKAVVPGPLLTPRLPTLRQVWIGLGELERNDAGGGRGDDSAALSAAEDAVWPADELAVVHTSGSTSAPKGVIHSHGALIRNMRRQNGLRGLGQRDRLFANSPFFWIGGLAYSFLATLIAGGRLVCSAAPPREMLDLLEAERPNIVNGVATTVLALAGDPSFPGRDMSFIREGNLYPIMPPAVRPADPELQYNLLGMTETGSVCLYARNRGDLPEAKRGSFGRPVPGLDARVVDPDTGRDAPAGELWFRGANLMQGYYGRERHESFTPDGWFRTGDMVTVDRDGDYFFHGRQGDIIKTAGANVSPREVEAAIGDVLKGRNAIVLGIPDPARGQRVVAVVIGSADVDVEALRGSLRSMLSSYKVPRDFHFLPEAAIPTLSSGKVDIRALADRVRAM